MNQTRREQIIVLLQRQPCSLEYLARQIGAPFKVISEDLNHIERSIKAEFRLRQHPAECQACGFVFANREKWHRPSRCPKCKSERISEVYIELYAK